MTDERRNTPDARNAEAKRRERARKDTELSRADRSEDPQLKRIHESAGSDDELGRGNDVPMEHGGARHRQQ